MKPLFLIVGLVVLAGITTLAYEVTSHGEHATAASSNAAPGASASTDAAPLSNGYGGFVAANSGANGGANSSPANEPADNAMGAGTNGNGELAGGNGRHHGGGHMMQLMSQLNLSEDQKAKIAQIRQTVTDHKQRREAILGVLTPDQQAELRQLRAQQPPGEGKHKKQGEAPTTAATPPTGAPSSMAPTAK